VGFRHVPPAARTKVYFNCHGSKRGEKGHNWPEAELGELRTHAGSRGTLAGGADFESLASGFCERLGVISWAYSARAENGARPIARATSSTATAQHFVPSSAIGRMLSLEEAGKIIRRLERGIPKRAAAASVSRRGSVRTRIRR
jgi:hypothetical protein